MALMTETACFSHPCCDSDETQKFQELCSHFLTEDLGILLFFLQITEEFQKKQLGVQLRNKISQEYTLANAEGQVMLLHWLMTDNAATTWNTLYPTITHSHRWDNWPHSSFFKSLRRSDLELFWLF